MDTYFNVFSWFLKGGVVMYPLLLCSFVVVVITAERGLYFWKTKTDVTRLMEAIDYHLKKGDWDTANEVCQSFGGAFSAMLIKLMKESVYRDAKFEQYLDGAVMSLVAEMRRGMDYLEVIVTLAPLLGLLGTVTGMIHSFQVLSVKAGQPLAVTGGIGEALIATATGLCVAILALMVNSFFSHRVNNFILDMERVCNQLLFYPREKVSHEI